MGSVHEIQASQKRQPLSSRERDLQIRNQNLEQYVARLLTERVQLVICPGCKAEREEVRR